MSLAFTCKLLRSGLSLSKGRQVPLGYRHAAGAGAVELTQLLMSLRAIYLAGAISLAGLLGCSKPPADEPDGALSVEVATAKTGSIRELLPIDGSFELPEGSFTHLTTVTAGKIAKVYVKEGDRVRAGQLLAIIDTSVQTAETRSAESGAAAANAQATQSETGFRAADAEYKAALQSATAALNEAVAERTNTVREAQADLDLVKAAARPEEVDQAQQDVSQAQSVRDEAFAQYERDRKLFADGFVSAQKLESSRTALSIADSALKQAKSKLSLLQAGARREAIAAAEAHLRSAKEVGDHKVAVAKAALEEARQGRLSVAAKGDEARANRLLAAQKQADAAAARSSAKNGEVRAPFDGVITKRMFNPGDAADPTIPILEMARGGAKADFVGTLSPIDAAKVTAGMAAELGDSKGRVRSVGVPDAQSRLTPVRILFLDSAGEAGKFATAKIVLRTMPSVVLIPRAAVVTREEKAVVFTVSEDTAHMTEVELGPAESDQVAILKGLKAGDTIILVGQHELSDGAKVRLPDKKEKA